MLLSSSFSASLPWFSKKAVWEVGVLTLIRFAFYFFAYSSVAVLAISLMNIY